MPDRYVWVLTVGHQQTIHVGFFKITLGETQYLWLWLAVDGALH